MGQPASANAVSNAAFCCSSPSVRVLAAELKIPASNARTRLAMAVSTCFTFISTIDNMI